MKLSQQRLMGVTVTWSVYLLTLQVYFLTIHEVNVRLMPILTHVRGSFPLTAQNVELLHCCRHFELHGQRQNQCRQTLQTNTVTRWAQRWHDGHGFSLWQLRLQCDNVSHWTTKPTFLTADPEGGFPDQTIKPSSHSDWPHVWRRECRQGLSSILYKIIVFIFHVYNWV